MHRILALDLSTHCGFAVFEDGKLVQHGVINLPNGVFAYGKYPIGFVKAAENQIDFVMDKALEFDEMPVIVVETINNGKNRFTQQLLNFLHFALVQRMHAHDTEVFYVDSSAWRQAIGLEMTKEQKKANAKLSKAKREAAQSGAKLDKKKIGVKGKVTPKHLAIAHVNEVYGLKLKVKDNDAADAICIGEAWLKNVRHSEGG